MSIGDSLGKFTYRGPISSSKSLYNRALVVQSFFPDIKLNAYSECDDVKNMIAATKSLHENLHNSAEINCGEAGTVLRFMAFRASREKGVFRLRGKSRLFQRPQKELLVILNQLSVEAKLLPNELIIKSKSWQRPLIPLQINRERTSQFSTGILMSAWNLDFPLEFKLHPMDMHDTYWNMSLDFVRQLGMEVILKGKDHYLIPAGQTCFVRELAVEPDYSSAMAVATIAAIAGEAHLLNVGNSSLQPDYAFIKILKNMGILISLEKDILHIQRVAKVSPVNVSVQETPDLFPVLAILCAFAEGESRLTGAPRLALKESNRITKTSELLQLIGVKNNILEDGIIIHGKGEVLKPRAFEFDPDQDHRMAMAAGILIRAGWPIKLKTPEVVKKSFPEFWQILGIKT